ncbi:MAG: response regulator transcription factor [Dehalococcoidia bacterium]
MRVLVIEDDRRLQRLLRRVLEEANLAVDEALDGETGEDLARQGKHDLIVLDVMLPGRDGYAVCQRLRTAGISTPILMLTARDTIHDRVRGLDAGADDYLVKPFATEELLARLRSLARRPRNDATDRPLVAHGLTLDLARHEVTRDGVNILLTTKEFTLLECFLRHPNQVLSRSQLLASVWGNESDVISNVVDTYVHYLRDKIDRNYRPKLLHTVRGVGYVLRT